MPKVPKGHGVLLCKNCDAVVIRCECPEHENMTSYAKELCRVCSMNAQPSTLKDILRVQEK